jgi:hypothetical protein
MAGESLRLVAGRRKQLAASVAITVTNRTGELLEARREWVKGGEAANRTVSKPRTHGRWDPRLNVPRRTC